MSAFSRYIGIDYSGAKTPEASLKGLRVYCAVGEAAANVSHPPKSQLVLKTPGRSLQVSQTIERQWPDQGASPVWLGRSAPKRDTLVYGS